MADLAHFLRQHFEFYQQPKSWYQKAVTLRAAASTLYASMADDLDRYENALQEAQEKLSSSADGQVEIEHDAPDVLPFYLLSGYAIENLLKAVMVYRSPSLINADHLSSKLTKHELPLLAETAGVEISPHEAAVLRWLEEVVVWKGRYQAPLKRVRLGKFWAFDHADKSMREMCNKLIDDIFNRAVAMLPHDATKPNEGKGLLVAVDQ